MRSIQRNYVEQLYGVKHLIFSTSNLKAWSSQEGVIWTVQLMHDLTTFYLILWSMQISRKTRTSSSEIQFDLCDMRSTLRSHDGHMNDIRHLIFSSSNLKAWSSQEGVIWTVQIMCDLTTYYFNLRMWECIQINNKTPRSSSQIQFDLCVIRSTRRSYDGHLNDVRFYT